MLVAETKRLIIETIAVSVAAAHYKAVTGIILQMPPWAVWNPIPQSGIAWWQMAQTCKVADVYHNPADASHTSLLGPRAWV